jgi:hypothetical protein
MPIQIDTFETQVDITPPASGNTTRHERTAAPTGQPGAPADLAEAVKQVIGDAFDAFVRMNGL